MLRTISYKVITPILLVGSLLLSSAWGMIQSSTSFAQEAADTEQGEMPELSSDTIFESRPQNSRLITLDRLYKDQVEAYRTADRVYRTAFEQDQQLQTLSSLEEAVQASQEVMKRRTDVLLTYTEIMLVQLQDTLGLELTLKSAVEEKLTEQITALREHRALLDEANDRDKVREAGQKFSEILPDLQRFTASARTLILFGNLQTVYDKAQLIATDIRKQQQALQASALKQAERDRAFTETQRLLSSVSDVLRSQRENIAGQLEKERGSFSIAPAVLNQVYSDLSKSLEYLEELLRI